MRRSGTILIIVAGICALLASLTLAFILRSRSSLEETNALEADVQARIMLIAACNYVCEASRIGYEPLNPLDPLYPLVDPVRLSNSPDHIEAVAASHAVHVLGGIIALGTILLRNLTPTDKLVEIEKRKTLAQVVGWYWHFMGVLWLALFILLGFWK